MRAQFRLLKSITTACLRGSLLVLVLITAPHIVLAQSAVSGPTLASGPCVAGNETGCQCLQRVFGVPVTGSNQLNCTANDIRLSQAVRAWIELPNNGGTSNSCIEGSTIGKLYATFDVAVTANARYDAGFFFRIDGGPNARGDGTTALGRCAVSSLNPNTQPGLNLDGDASGDLNSGTYAYNLDSGNGGVTFLFRDVACVKAPGSNPAVLRLPNCTSWHSNIGTVASGETALSFRPDTKSKCVCDDTFTLPISVETFTVGVDKSATPTEVGTGGGDVTYTVVVQNQSNYTEIEVTGIVDDHDINDGGAAGYVALPNGSDCAQWLSGTSGDATRGDLRIAPQASKSCTFTVRAPAKAAGSTLTDRVKVSSRRTADASALADQTDTATVNYETLPTPTLTKAVTSRDCLVEATYSVTVSNPSTRSITVSALHDDKFGDIKTVHAAGNGFEEVKSTTCDNLSVIGGLSSGSCSFVGVIADRDCTVNHTNTVTATATTQLGSPISPSPSGSATVYIDTTPATAP